MKRSPLQRGKPLARTGPLPKRKRYAGGGWLKANTWLNVEARDGAGCLNCRAAHHLDLHHCVTRQRLRQIGRSDLDSAEANLVLLCRGCHTEHHSRRQPLRWEQLPGCVRDFADGLGLIEYLARAYPRLDRLTTQEDENANS